MKLSDAVKGKEVLVVGNSRSLLLQDYSELIDSHEFVIRFNHSIAYLHRYAIGQKCDAWIFAMMLENLCQEIYSKAEVKPDLCVRYDRHPPVNLGRDYIHLDCEPKDVALAIDTKKDPSVGISTIWYLLNKAFPAKIKLIGFDSFKKANFYRKRISRSVEKRHQAKAEERYLNKQSEEGNIIFLDR